MSRSSAHPRVSSPCPEALVEFLVEFLYLALEPAGKPQVFIDYHKAVLTRTLEYLKTLSGEDLDRELQEPWFQPLPTVGVRMVSILNDCVIHAGQAGYVRGLRQGKGWQKY